MNPHLDEIFSIINGHVFAKDKDRVFTYIEFVKMFGYENNPNVFITYYKEYVTRWANIKHEEITVTDDEFVFSKLIEILKSITLDYSSYEEQDFIAHINLNNKAHLKALSAIYSRKIREITEFYRKKRNESVLVVHRNSIKGSTKSIQEIIYEKVFDFIFSNRNIVPSYKNIKRDLLVTVEQYVDTYSEYFDIPRNYEFTDESRREMLTANINEVDYRMYLEIELVVSELLFSGNVMLEEIPLIAQLGVDLSQSCVGDMLALKNSLVANTTINQVDLNEQVALKRKLYEKFLGCDLWYMYVDLQGGIKMDVLCKAKNPTGNLLNCGSPDTATIPSGQEELLSHIGLFFKPDKTSILKVNAKDYTWTIDTDNLIEDTVYIFPDPNKYGDIGNNKDNNYPLIMEYRTDYDIRNISSGTSADDPLMFITDQGWRSYYSKQDDDFKHIKNTNWEYSFTYLSNKGFLSQYQKDIWGNEWGLLKGAEMSQVTKEVYENGKIVTKTIPKLTLTGKGFIDEMIFGENEDTQSQPRIINGGYFEHPLYPGNEIRKNNGELAWVYQGSEEKVMPFNYDLRLILNKNYSWSGIEVHGIPQSKEPEFSPSLYDTNYINFGSFGDNSDIVYEDHFRVVPSNYADIIGDDRVLTDLMQQFFSINLLENPEYADIEFETKEATFEEIQEMSGDLFIKLVNDYEARPVKFTQLFNWIPNVENLKILSFKVYNDNVIIDTEDEIIFAPYTYDGNSITSNLGLRRLLRLPKDVPTKALFLEDVRKFYILQLKEWKTFNINRIIALPYIYEFDPVNYTLKEIINPFDGVYKHQYEQKFLSRVLEFDEHMVLKKSIIGTGELLKTAINNNQWTNFLDFEVPQYDSNEYGNLGFTYNSALGTFLISYVIIDTNGTPYIYEHKFKLTSLEDFESSLKTNVYTLKSLTYNDDGELNDVYWVHNSTLGGGTMKCYPYDGISPQNIFIGNLEFLYNSSVDFNNLSSFSVDMSQEYSYSISQDFNNLSSFSIGIPEEYSYSISQNFNNLSSFSIEIPEEYSYSLNQKISDYNVNFEIDDKQMFITYDDETGYAILEDSDLSSLRTTWGSGNRNLMSYENGITELTDDNCDLSRLFAQHDDFTDCKNLTKVTTNLSSLRRGDYMFDRCISLRSFTSPLSSIEYGSGMFYGCSSLTTFTSDLSSLKSGKGMFDGCKLNANSVHKILSTIRDITNVTDASGELGLGVSTEGMNKFAEITGTRGNCTYKGWTITITEN